MMMKSLYKYLILILISYSSLQNTKGQNFDYPHEFPLYSFINYDTNAIYFGKKSQEFIPIFELLNSIITKGQGHLNIVHIGASHVQADMMSGKIRTHLFNMFHGAVSNRGYVFPFSMAKTNHPFNYYSDFTGNWEACRNVQSNRNCNLGLGGISALTKDSSATFNLYFRKWNHPYFYFNDIKVLHATGDTVFDIDIITQSNNTFEKIQYNGYTQFYTEKTIDTLSFQLFKTDSLQNQFETYGAIVGMKDFNGLTYNGIGINGASVPSYLRCNLFEGHLALLDPQLVILSIGINDAHDNDFDPIKFKQNYLELIKRIKTVAPDAYIILTTNSDSYFKRRTPNKNSLLAKEVVYELIHTVPNCALWDWHTIMGGLGSIATWETNGLAKKDRVHFTREGYELLGNLFFSAFIKSYENYLLKK